MAFAVASLRPPFFPPVRIEPEQRKRVDGERLECPRCGKQFIHSGAKSPLGVPLRWSRCRPTIRRCLGAWHQLPTLSETPQRVEQSHPGRKAIHLKRDLAPGVRLPENSGSMRTGGKNGGRREATAKAIMGKRLASS